MDRTNEVLEKTNIMLKEAYAFLRGSDLKENDRLENIIYMTASLINDIRLYIEINSEK